MFEKGNKFYACLKRETSSISIVVHDVKTEDTATLQFEG